MADLHKLTVQEAVNTETAAVWDINSVLTANASSGAALNLDVSSYHTLGLKTDGAIYFSFQNNSTAAKSTANDLILDAGLSFIKIPKGLGNTIYFNYLSTSSSTVEVRVVKM